MEINYKKVLNKHGFAFKKAFGQNFLSDESLLEEIVEKAGVNSDDIVLEIGLGAGALTRCLAKKAKKVVGYEIDRKLQPVLTEVLSDFNNVEIVYKDVLKEPVSVIDKKLGKDFILVANLPYYITTPLILRFLEQSKNVKAMFVMVQEEVAERLASNEKDGDYGAITVGINLRGSAQIVLRVNREKFYPVPNVDSAVVGILLDRNKNLGVDLNLVRKVVKVAFQNRRKTLINNLVNGLNISREQALKILSDLGLNELIRGEELSADDFVKLTEKIKEIIKL